MTKTIQSALISLAVLAYSPASAHTDLSDNYTDFPSHREYAPQQRYASRTECELPGRNSVPSVRNDAAISPSVTLVEKLIAALKDDCGTVRVEKGMIICEDSYGCIREEERGPVYMQDCEYCPDTIIECKEWKVWERWRFDPTKIGKVEALLIDTQRLPSGYHSAGYAIRPVGKNELYLFQTEFAARRLQNIINYVK